MKKKLLILLIFLILAVAAYSLFRLLSGGGKGPAQGYSGTVEAVEVLPSFQIAGKIAKAPFQEGQSLKAGQVLAFLDTRELLQQATRARAGLALAQSRLEPLRTQAEYLEKSVEARISAARAALEKVKAGPREQEIESARQAVNRARAAADLAAEKAERALTLYQKEVIPLARRDEAVKEAEAAEAVLRQAEEALNLAEEGARTEDLRIAQANLASAKAEREAVERARLEISTAEHQVELAQAEVDLADTRLGYATLRMPIDGVVLSRNIEAGETVSPGIPVASISDLSAVEVRFYVEEPDLGIYSPGAPVRLRSDSFKDETFTGTLTFLSDRAEFTPKMVLTKGERTRLVFMAKAVFDNPDRKLKPGMPVDVFLEENP